MKTIEYGPENPKPYQRKIAELKYQVDSETGVISNQQKTGLSFTRAEWNKKGFFFPRYGQTITLGRA